MPVANLGYLHIAESSANSWRDFGANILGLMPIERSNYSDTTFLKMDDQPFRLMVSAANDSQPAGLVAAGWEMANKAEYDAMLLQLQNAGVEIQHGDEAGAKLRCVSEYVCAADPCGSRFEIYHGRTSDTACGVAFESPLGIKTFVTGPMGLGHLVIPAPEIEKSHQFYCEALGFKNSDDLNLPPFAEGFPDQRIIFMHANNPRHHSLALYNFPNPVGIIHLMVEVADVDEVGKGLDRVQKAGLPLLASLGRHLNDQMLSFYVFGPDGIAVEYGCEGLQIDDSFEATVSTIGDIWGHDYQMPAPE